MQEKSLARNGIYKALLNIFNLVVPLLVGPYVTGLLNEELYGIYNRVYTEYSVFLALASFGIYNYGVREISRVRNDPVATNKLFTSLSSSASSPTAQRCWCMWHIPSGGQTPR